MNERIELEDWLLPVVHENRPLRLDFQPMTDEEETVWYSAQADRSPEPQTAYGFFGRDLDVLRIEKALLTRGNILLVQGMGGSGKTTLLRHLMHWAEVTGLVARSVYFGWDSEAWTRARIMRETIRSLYPEKLDLFDRLPDDEARQAMLSERLRADRHLLVLDNLESITGERLAIQHSLDEAERAALQRFLQALAGGRSSRAARLASARGLAGARHVRGQCPSPGWARCRGRLRSRRRRAGPRRGQGAAR